MSNSWPKVKLGDVLRRVERFEKRDDLTDYQFAGTYSFARGIFVGERKVGSTFALPKIQRIREGDFVYCKIMAWEGAFGVVPKETDGCVLSGAFVVYEVKSDLIYDKFLDYFFKVPAHWQNIGSQSSGTNVRRQSLHPEQFEEAKISLPPLNEQRRIVARIEELVTKIKEVRQLQKEVATEMESLCRAMITNPSDGKTAPTAMRDLVTLRDPDVVVEPTSTYHFAGVYCFGKGVFPGHARAGSEFSYRVLTKLRKGDFVYPKLMAWEGAFGIVPEECDGLYVSPEFPVFEVLKEQVLPEVLDTFFKMPSVWPELGAISTGTNVRRRRLHPKAFLQYNFPLPSMKIQLEFLTVKRHIEEAKPTQAEAAAELDALMPSILSRAFRGEL